MTSSSSGLDLREIFDQLMVRHVRFGKLIFAPTLKKTAILREIEGVASFLDDTISCTRCKLSCIPSMHFLKGQGIICGKCHTESDLKPERESAGCDTLLTETISSCLFNTRIMTAYLLENLNTQTLVYDGEESDDPEVQFPFFPNKASPAKWNKSNAKLYLAAKKFLTRFEKPSAGSDDLEVDKVNIANGIETRKKIIEVKEECVTKEECPESNLLTHPKIRFLADKSFKPCSVVVHRLDESNLAKSHSGIYSADYSKSALQRSRKRSPVKSRPGPQCKKLSF